MSRTLRNVSAASEEFTAAVRWYEKQRPGLGTELYEDVTETTARIPAHPEIGALVLPGARRVLVPRFVLALG